MIKNAKLFFNRINNLSFGAAIIMKIGISISITLIVTALILLIVDNIIFISHNNTSLLEHSVNTGVAIFAECFIISAIIDIYNIRRENQ